MMSDSPKVSVLLPVYNGQQFLREAVQSVLDQSFQDFELIALDDGSSDRSLPILHEFAARDPRVRVISRENRGLVATLNQLIGEARGEYLARMDADDICDPGRFAMQCRILEQEPDVGVVGASVLHIDADGRPICRIAPPETHTEIDALHLTGHCSIWHPTVIMRAGLVRAMGGYRSAFEYAEDFDLWLRMAEHCQLRNVRAVLLRYRIHAKSISEVFGTRQDERTRQACEEAWVRRGIHGTYKSDGHWRAQGSGQSRLKFALQYGWTAWASGFRETWRTYAWKAVCMAPFSGEAWKLLLLGWLRRPPQGGGV